MLLSPVFLALVTTAVALAQKCLSDKDALSMVSDYTTLITKTQADFNTTLAKQLLASDYHSTSSGVDYVREYPLNATAFTSRQAFIDQQLSIAPFPSVTTENVYHTCDVLIWRYTINTLPLPVGGITIFLVNISSPAKQIQTGYYEINSGALLYNLGLPECEANWTVSA